jgi:hypothetical protein
MEAMHGPHIDDFPMKNVIYPWQTVELPEGRQFRIFLVFSLSLSISSRYTYAYYVCMF